MAVWMLRRLLPEDLRLSVLEDLGGRYADLARLVGSKRARRWYWSQTLRSFQPTLQYSRLSVAAGLARRRSTLPFDLLWQELLAALRQIWRDPAFTAIAAITLAIGIGATVTIFSAIDVWMFRPLPFEQPDRLVHVFSQVPARDGAPFAHSLPDFLDFREQSETMDIASRRSYDYNLSGDGEPERILGEKVSWNLFAVLRVPTLSGRFFRPEEERAGQPRVCVVSEGLWRRRFGADPEILGRTILLDAVPHDVIGVLPGGFWEWFGDRRSEIWTPFEVVGNEGRGTQNLTTVGRLKPGVSVRQASSEALEIARRIEESHPDTNVGVEAGVRPLHELVFDTEVRLGSTIASVAALFVLLIACANVANLMLTRVAGRDREIAVRRAMGAGAGRIVRNLLTEATVISILGGALGVLLSIAGVRGLMALIPPWFPFIDQIGIDERVLGFAVLVTAMTPVLFGIAPSLQISRPYFVDSLKEGPRASAGGRTNRLRNLIVIAEVSLAATLLVASVLLARGFFAVQTTDSGWNEENVLTFEVALPESQYPEFLVEGFYRYLLSSLDSLPGVEGVGGVSRLPFRGDEITSYAVAGQEPAIPQLSPLASFRFVLPGYFEAMQTTIVRGRSFDYADGPRGRPVIIVNQTLADRHWPDVNPVGKEILLWGVRREIVGVARDTLDAISEDRAMVFLSAVQLPTEDMSMVVRTSGAPGAMVGAIRSEVTALDPNLPIHSVASMAEIKAGVMESNAVLAKIMAYLAGLALTLAMVGVYGVVSYSVSRRTQEMGVRMALGARRSDLLAMVIGQGTKLALIGLIVGFFISSLVTETLSVFLFGVEPLDPLTFGLAAVALLSAGVAATYFPARRATRADPLEALRSE